MRAIMAGGMALTGLLVAPGQANAMDDRGTAVPVGDTLVLVEERAPAWGDEAAWSLGELQGSQVATGSFIDPADGRIVLPGAGVDAPRAVEPPVIEPAVIEPPVVKPGIGGRYRVHAAAFLLDRPLGAMRLAFSGGYRSTLLGDPLESLACGGQSRAWAVAAGPLATCGSVAPRKAGSFHQRTIERTWQGSAEGVWSLDADNALILRGGFRRTRRLHDEAYALATSARPDPARVAAFGHAGRTGGAFDGASTPTDSGVAFGSGMIATFRQKEKVASVLAATRLAWGAATLTPALRYERTRLRIGGFRSQDGITGNPMDLRRTYGSLLPAASLAADLAPGLAVGLRWSRDVVRPDLVALAPGAIVERRNPQVWMGNPDLRPARLDSFAISAAWRKPERAELSIGVFSRGITDPIIAANDSRTDAIFAGRRYPRVTLTQTMNAPNGAVAGVRAELHHHLAFLPPALSPLDLRLSGGYTRSRLTLADGGRTRFPFEPALRYGVALGWSDGPLDAEISWNATSNAVVAIQDGKPGTVVERRLRRLNTRARFKFSPGMQVFFEAQNLTDEPSRQLQDAMRSWAIDGERYGRSISAGFWARF